MKNNSTTLYSFLLVVGDFLALVASFVIAYILRVKVQDNLTLVNQIESETFLAIFLALLPVWIIIFATLGLYNERIYSRKFAEMGRILVGSFVGILFVIGYEFVSDEPIFPARLVAVYGFVLGFSLLVLFRMFLWQLRRAMFRYGWWVDRIMIIGSSSATKDLIQLLGHTRSSGYDIVAVIGSKDSLPSGFSGKHFSTIDEGLKALPKLNVHTILQTKLYDSDSKNRSIAEAARLNHAAFRFVPNEANLYGGKVNIELFYYYPMVSIHQTPLQGWGRIAKRLFDVGLSFVGLLLLLPVLLMIAVIMKLIDRGPIFFKQKRLTRYGNQVNIYKLRTMKRQYNDRDAIEVFKSMGRDDLVDEYQKNRNKVANDPRVSSFARFLRKTSLDELPQLLNVLKGDISLVGPRSIPEAELAEFENEKPILVSVKTGITGLAQVSGRSDITMQERIRLDLYYVQNWSFWMDLRILAKTIAVVLRRSDAK